MMIKALSTSTTSDVQRRCGDRQRLKRLLSFDRILGGVLLGASAIFWPTAASAQEDSARSETANEVSEEDSGTPAEEAEIIVTGTYLGSDFPPSSPVDVIGEELFEARPQVSIAAALSELPYVAGGGGGQDGGQAASNVNLRGLGADATLVLLNGRRQVRVPTTSAVVDVNTLIPQIMVRSIEILKDGASALYGSDAVAGVVNFRIDNTFEGLDLSVEGRWQTAGADRAAYTPFLKENPGNYRASGKFGIGSDRGNLVLAAEYSRRDLVATMGLPGIGGRAALVPIPGQLTTIRRNASGLPAGSTTTIADPNCGEISSTTRTGATCSYEFNVDQTYLSGQERIQTFARGEYRFSPSLKFVAEAGFAHQESTLSETASPSLSVSPALVVPGENPAVQALGNGTLFRARNSLGQVLYAQPDPSNPSRPARDANGRVIVTGINPASGIPFWEDITYSGRVILSQGGLPTGGILLPGEYAHANPTTDTSDVFRLSVGLEGELALLNGFDWSAFYTRASYDLDDSVRDTFPNQLRLALQGFAGANCNPLTNTPGAGSCSYFNPFIISALVPVGHPAANEQETIDYFYKTVTTRYRTALDVVDVIANGSLFTLPAGDVNIAVGGQYRREEWNANYPENFETGNTANATVSSDIAANQETWSAFSELGVPVIDGSLGTLDLNGALRYEKSDAGSTVDPKVGATYVDPTGLVTVRGTWGQSFLSPNLFQQFTQSAGLANVTSTIGGTRPPTLQPRVATIRVGNSNLEPQRAEAWNLGIVLRPMNRLRLSADRWHFKYDGLITQENPQTLVNIDDAALAAGQGPTGTIIRDASGNVIQVLTTFFNAASLVTSGYDFQASYWHDLARFGRIDLSANATFVDRYDYQATVLSPVLELAGNWNGTNRSVNPSVKFRAIFDATWTLDNHALRAHVNHVGGMDNDQANPAVAGDARFHSFTTLDLSYSYRFNKWVGKDAKVSMGMANVFNSRPDQISALGSGAATGVYDYLGRTVWVSADVSF